MPSPQSQLVSFILRRVVKSRAQRSTQPRISFVREAVESLMQLVWTTPGPPVKVRQRPEGAWLEPRDAPERAVILYFHGGGYFFCSPRTHRPLTEGLAAASGLRVLSARYRLAPEHPYPAALEDAVAHYQRLLACGYRVVLAGDSAGGGLTLATLVALRERGLPQPAGAICFSPWTDLAGTGPSLDANDRSCAMFCGHSLRRAAAIYLGEADPRAPLASPLYADLHGLPPLLIHVSDSEVLLDDSTRLAARAQAAGVEVQLKIWPRQPHAWQLFSHVVPEGRASLQEAARFARILYSR